MFVKASKHGPKLLLNLTTNYIGQIKELFNFAAT